MTSSVTAISAGPSVASAPAVLSQPATSLAPTASVSTLNGLTPQQDVFTLSQVASPKRSWASWGINAGINVVKRLWNGVRNVVNMFMPGQIGRTLRDTAMWTAGLSVFSFFLTGPLHIPAIPLYAMASLGFDAAGKFIAGIWQNPNKPGLHSVQVNQLGFMTPDQRRSLGFNS